MTTTNSYRRQPTKQDYADPTKFNEKSAEEIAKEAIKKFKSLNS